MSKYKVGDVVKLRDDLRNDVIGNKPLVIDRICRDGTYLIWDDNGSEWYLMDETIEGLWEECKEKQDKLKLIDVLNMIAKGELKEGTKVIRGEETYIWNNKDCFFYNEKDNFICLDPMKCLNDEVELIEPECEHEWEVETIRNGIGELRRFRRCVKCGLEEETEDNHFADVGKMEKIEELIADEINGKSYAEAISIIGGKLNEVIRVINKE